MKTGLAPVIGKNPEILILGSLPGDESIRRQQYYGHPQNKFWYILGKVLGVDLDGTYEERLAILKKNKIAIWDVYKKAKRKGSLDSNIKEKQLNDFGSIPKSVQLIIFNGKEAFKQAKHIPLDIKMIDVPSSSPLNTMDKDDKVKIWKKAFT